LIESTGYGTATGLLGINCRHSLFIFFEGVSRPEYTQAELDRINNTKVTYDGQQMDLYEATQKQRYIERQIRDWKRKAGALNAGGLDNTEERLKVGQWQAKARDFTKQTGLVRRYEWEQAAGTNVRGLTKRPVKVATYFQWEIPELRTKIQSSFEPFGKPKYENMFVPKNILAKLSGKHAIDMPYINKVGEVVNHWELRGISPKNELAMECYKKLDEIWFIAVIKDDSKMGGYILTTFHRLYDRKVMSRLAGGYLVKR
jgi:hypothetical protein